MGCAQPWCFTRRQRERSPHFVCLKPVSLSNTLQTMRGEESPTSAQGLWGRLILYLLTDLLATLHIPTRNKRTHALCQILGEKQHGTKWEDKIKNCLQIMPPSRTRISFKTQVSSNVVFIRVCSHNQTDMISWALDNLGLLHGSPTISQCNLCKTLSFTMLQLPICLMRVIILFICLIYLAGKVYWAGTASVQEFIQNACTSVLISWATCRGYCKAGNK